MPIFLQYFFGKATARRCKAGSHHVRHFGKILLHHMCWQSQESEEEEEEEEEGYLYELPVEPFHGRKVALRKKKEIFYS